MRAAVRAAAPMLRSAPVLRPRSGLHSLAPRVAAVSWPRSATVPQRRCLSTEVAPSSSSESEGPPTSPKVSALVDEIASLSLLEAAELTEALKVRASSRRVARSRVYAYSV